MIKSKEEIADLIDEMVEKAYRPDAILETVKQLLREPEPASQFPSQGLREENDKLRELIKRLRQEIFNCGGAQIQ